MFEDGGCYLSKVMFNLWDYIVLEMFHGCGN